MRLFVFAVCWVGWLLVSRPSFARSGGITGYSGKEGINCNDCHSAGSAPVVTLSGPASLATNASATYTLLIQGGAAIVGGVDIAVSGSSAHLATVSGSTTVFQNELFHSSPINFSAGSLTVTFRVTAPASAGSFTIFGSGNSCDGDTSNSGDQASSNTLTVTVTAPMVDAATPDMVDASPGPDAAPVDAPIAHDSASPDLIGVPDAIPIPYDAAPADLAAHDAAVVDPSDMADAAVVDPGTDPPPTDDPTQMTQSGGCSFASSAGSSGVALLGLFLLLFHRRRHFP